MSPVSAVEEFPTGSGELEVQVGPDGEACGLARDLGTAGVIGQSPGEHPEEPAALSKPLADPFWKEPQLQEEDPSGEPDRVGKGRAVDWRSPEVLDKYGSMERLFEWSSPEEGDCSEEEEWLLISSTSAGASTGVPESKPTYLKPSVSPLDFHPSHQRLFLLEHSPTNNGL